MVARTDLHIASSFGRVLSQLFSANMCSRSGKSPNSPGNLGKAVSSGLMISKQPWQREVASECVRRFVAVNRQQPV